MRNFLEAARVEIKTAYGTAIFVLTSGSTIYVDANTNCRGDFLAGWTVNGVRYGVSGHVQKLGPGWVLAHSPSDPRGVYASYIFRVDDGRDPSPSARAKIRAELVDAVNAWASQTVHAEGYLREAEARGLNNEAMRLEEEIAEIEKTLAGKNAELVQVNIKERQVGCSCCSILR